MSWFTDLIDTAVSTAQDLTDPSNPAAQQILYNAGTTIDVVPVQNETVGQFSAVLNQYNGGQITAAVAVADIQKYLAAFALYAQKIGNSRALRGLADVQTLANRILTGFGAPPQSNPSGPPVTIPAKSSLGGLLTPVNIGIALVIYFAFVRKS